MSRPVIAVDVDEVLLPLHEPFLYHHNEQYGTDFVYPDAQGRYYLHEFNGDDLQITIKKLKKFYKSGETKHLQPLPGAVTALNRLHKQYDLVIISNQQKFQGKYTKVALREHFGDIFKELYFTASHPRKRKPLKKSDICKKVGAGYLIDDHVSNALHCTEAGIGVILFGNYHWNKHEDLPVGIVRCKGWQEVLEYFDGKAGR